MQRQWLSKQNSKHVAYCGSYMPGFIYSNSAIAAVIDLIALGLEHGPERYNLRRLQT